VKIDNIHLICN